MLNTDKPIDKNAQDVLRFDVFAHALAKAIAHQPNGHGLVIAINGVWGSGKTSAINLALQQLEIIEKDLRPKRKSSVVVHFSPWLFTGQHNLASQFFSALAPALEKTFGQKAADAAIAMKDVMVESAAGIFDTAALVATATGQAGAATAAKGLGKLAKGVKKDETTGLVRRREKLQKILQDQTRKIVVVIDDIDRLQPDEIRLVLSMLKSVADLPNVVYLLPVDLAVIKEATNIKITSRGASFLEKIVQVNLDLPNPSRHGLAQLFNNALHELVGHEVTYEIEDMELIRHYVFNAYIKTPRSVNLLANALRVSWPAMKEDAYFPDVVGIEAIRLFEPGIYEYIRNAKSHMLRGQGSEKGKKDKIFEGIKNLAKPEQAEETMSLMSSLFTVFGFSSRRFPKSTDSLFGRRICDEEGFDLYFRWDSDGNVVRINEMRDFQRLITAGKDASVLVEKLAHRQAQGDTGVSAVVSLLEAINTQKIKPPPDNISAVMALLLNHDEIIKSKNDSDFLLPARRQLQQALGILFDGLSPTLRANECQSILENNKVSVDACTLFLGSFIYGKDNDQGKAINKDKLKELLDNWLVRRVKTNKGLGNCDRPDQVLYLVAQTLGKNVARDLVTPFLTDKPFAIKLALDLMNRIHSSDRPQPYRELTEMPDPSIYNLKTLMKMLSEIDNIPLRVTDKKEVEEFQRDLRIFMSNGGKSKRDMAAQAASF
ncbi:MAG TPA: P-loop NTPase fold protein [Arenimonas sp.]|nr:P-loop NTPase fold protein [Arenimonas sp.]